MYSRLCPGPIVLYVPKLCRPEKRKVTILIPVGRMSLGVMKRIPSSFAWCKEEPVFTHADGGFKIMFQIRLSNPNEDLLEFAGAIKRWVAEEFKTTAYVSSVRSCREARLRFGDL